jgi:DNA polymerase III alpha subunit
MIKRYNNYHKHTCMSNIRSLDCVVKPIEYINRAKELDGEKAIYFTTEHGWQSDIFTAYTLCKENNVKMLVGAEVYYVENRLEKDKSNYHLVLIAKNNDGRKDLNRILSEANKSGFYYKPRIDDELLFSINPNNMIITTACVASRLRKEEGLDDWIMQMKNYFKDNFYLEVQNHNEEVQKRHNKKILELSKKYNIQIIHANDSHYIYPEDAKYRDLFLKAKGIVYEDESNFILDYPTYDEIVERYKKQGILSDDEIKQSLENTLIFDNFEGITIDTEIKMPHICENPKQELRDIINKEWSEREVNEIDSNRIDEYLEAIREEMQIIEDTNMSEYFVLDYKIMKLGKEKYGGVLTRTGRGSAPSFYVNKLLRFTDIDRLSSSVKLFPSRFMSTVRILETKSLPD